LLNLYNTQIIKDINNFERAKNFDATKDNSANDRIVLINDINNSYDNNYTHSVPILTIGLLNGNDLSLQRVKMKQLIADLEAQKEQSKVDS
jgi:hypothetical protein